MLETEFKSNHKFSLGFIEPQTNTPHFYLVEANEVPPPPVVQKQPEPIKIIEPTKPEPIIEPQLIIEPEPIILVEPIVEPEPPIEEP